LAIRKLLVTTSVPPALSSTAAVIVCMPSATVVVSNGSAEPSDAEPAKSYGAPPSVLRGLRAICGSSR
jgi:hypothetical protein